MENLLSADSIMNGEATVKAKEQNDIIVKNTYHFEAFDKDGNFLWEDYAENLVTNEGLDDVLDKYLLGSGYTADFYVLLTDGSPTPAVGDTLGDHSGWAEADAYAGDRKALTLAAVSGQSTNNGGNKAIFVIDADGTTIGGAGMCKAATLNTAVLYSVCENRFIFKNINNK